MINNPLLKGFEKVWERAHHVHINFNQLSIMARVWANQQTPLPDWYLPIFPEKDEEFTQFLGINMAINFGFVNPKNKKLFAVTYKDQLWKGSAALSACLMRALEDGLPILDAGYLSQLQEEELCKILKGNMARIPLFKERLQALRIIGNSLNGKFCGRFERLFSNADYRAFPKTDWDGGILDFIRKFFPPFYDSGFHYRSHHNLNFFQRAQNMIIVYHGRASADNSLKPIEDIDLVGPVADYQIPNALHDMKILEYDRGLERKILRRIELESGDEEEVEIRALSAKAVIELLKKINEIRSEKDRINICQLNHRLRQRSKRCLTPHHLTLCTSY
jgi:hypothetical protein